MAAVVRSGADFVAEEVLDRRVAAAHTAHRYIGALHVQSVGIGVEGGGIGGCLGQGHCAWVVAVAVLPLHEMVTFIGGGADFVAEEMLGCGIAAAHTAHRSIDALHVQSIGVGVEVGGDDAVAQCLHCEGGLSAEDSTRCVGPVHKVVAVVGRGGQGNSAQIVHCRGAACRAHGLVGALSGDSVLVVGEIGVEGIVV